MKFANKMFRFFILFLLFSSVSPLFAGGGSETMEQKGPITIGSKIDTEGSLLGNIIKLVLLENNFEVIDKIQTGTTPVVRQAIAAGEIDIYPEYTGNGFYFYEGQSEADTWKNAQSAYEQIKELDYENQKIVWLQPAPANNTWAIAIQGTVAEANGLVTLSDLADYVNSGGEFKIAGSEEFVSRADALPAFEAAYGFSLEESQLQVISSGNTALTEKAAADGQDGVNAGMAYGTDGNLAALGLVVLEDNLGVQPVYEPAPIIREEVYLAYPEIESLLKPIFESFNLVTLQTLNSKIAVDGVDAAIVAEDYLVEKGFISQ